ncbi:MULTISPECIES: CBASS oligonucleotide cyclase [Pseudoalteromonas]|jgi:tRNA nucleotidyltransferase (CCA-adding enzyme)|uniref:CBASS oligonucleotide cyclase n=1 Tax=Pseudoalteromonas TaxID=53246 RepID=UPI001EF4E3AB|nr:MULTISPECIES: CBASS oligonucleotide cyclase [Pseudoalteromonas]MCG7571922.1 nucleotidyltransferase [Pseudoalteromonas sp. CNC9-20]MDK9683647.1 CBASS oligonucleotide cyclase [Pseudoalteromonas shioyasakiensis]
MSLEHVNHKTLCDFAKDKVNLPKDRADKFRKQARNLREKLQDYLKEHPDFALKRMQLSGSLAKGTALRSLNDIDVAVYIGGVDSNIALNDLLDYLEEKIRKAYPNFSYDQIKRQTYSICVSFKGSGLDVDLVPIIYEGKADWRGYLVSQMDGSYLETSIPLHLEFAKKRKDQQPEHYAQIVRLVKFWARKQKNEIDGFRFKSFMIEMILAKLSDNGVDFSDYVEALQAFFTYIVKSNLDQKIIFEDYYKASEVKDFSDPIQIIDPVNTENNVSSLYTRHQADLIVNAAMDAGDAIDAAEFAPTKTLTVQYWQSVFGPSFTG